MGKKEELKETTKKLHERIDQIPRSMTCERSEVPNGRVWCNHYDQTLAGRCPSSCSHYKLRTETN
jgi:hypothetical protein